MFIKRTCISNFSKIEFVDQPNPCTPIYFHNIASCINLQQPIVILKKKTILLDMHYHKTYMYINFQQNQVKTQVMIVHTSLFAKIASCTNLQLPIIIFQNRLFRHASSQNVHAC